MSLDSELEKKLHKILPKVLKDLGIVYSANELVTTKKFSDIMEQFQLRQEQRDEKLRKDLDLRFDKIFQRLDQQSLALGHDFEEFNSL